MRLELLNEQFTICKIKSVDDIDFDCGFLFLGKTDEELSLVCPEQSVPEITLEREDGWLAFRIPGTLNFSLTGILSKIAAVLAESKVGIFAVSTFNTDYVLFKKENREIAVSALTENGYEFM